MPESVCLYVRVMITGCIGKHAVLTCKTHGLKLHDKLKDYNTDLGILHNYIVGLFHQKYLNTAQFFHQKKLL